MSEAMNSLPAKTTKKKDNKNEIVCHLHPSAEKEIQRQTHKQRYRRNLRSEVEKEAIRNRMMMTVYKK